MSFCVFIDVDRTVIDGEGKLREGAVKSIDEIKAAGCSLTLWSSAGADYAQDVARRHRIDHVFEAFCAKPDLAIDDEPKRLADFQIIDSGEMEWKSIRAAVIEAKRIDDGIGHRLPKFIQEMAIGSNDVCLPIAKLVWSQREKFIRWPKRRHLFMAGTIRPVGAARKDCYAYSPKQISQLIEAGVIRPGQKPRVWSNDPAIHSYQVAGGDRPIRSNSNWGWSIHHIYDGKFPAKPGIKSTHAAYHPDYFTEAAGLVAVHPVADALASHLPYFAWLLRFEAYCRFDGFDPDGVFATNS